MRLRLGSRSVAIGGIVLTMMSSAIAPVRAQMMSGFNALDPQWAYVNPFMSGGAGAGFNQQSYTAPLGSGTMGLFATSSGTSSVGSAAFAGSPFSFPSRQDWFASAGDSQWQTSSIVSSYKSAPNNDLFTGLYTTASFGVTSIKANPTGLSNLPGFTANSEAVAVTARAGVGLQLTPNISFEGSVGVTQMQPSNYR